MSSRLKDEVEAVIREMKTWPEWRKREIEAEVRKTPLRKKRDA